MKRWVPLLVAVTLSAPAGAAAQNTAWNRATLEDLGGVFIRIEVKESCSSVGLTAADFEAAVSLHLIEAEVGVLTREEMLRNAALPELRVDVDCAAVAGGDTAYTVGLRVQQAAQMMRDGQVTLPESVTWWTTRLGVADAASAKQAIESALIEQVAEFSAAWTEANADEGGRGR